MRRTPRACAASGSAIDKHARRRDRRRRAWPGEARGRAQRLHRFSVRCRRRLATIGKAYSGPYDAERVSRRSRSGSRRTRSRPSPLRIPVRPEIVLEVGLTASSVSSATRAASRSASAHHGASATTRRRRRRHRRRGAGDLGRKKPVTATARRRRGHGRRSAVGVLATSPICGRSRSSLPFDDSGVAAATGSIERLRNTEPSRGPSPASLSSVPAWLFVTAVRICHDGSSWVFAKARFVNDAAVVHAQQSK